MEIRCVRCGERWDVDHLVHDCVRYLCPVCGSPVAPDEDGLAVHGAALVLPGARGGAAALRCRWTGDMEQASVMIEPADNGETPAEVTERGGEGWLWFVSAGRGCPTCHGHPDLRTGPITPTASELLERDAATEGRFGDWLFGEQGGATR